jgi:hypothetical protein
VRASSSSNSAVLAPLALSTSITATTAVELSSVFDHVVWSGDLNFRINAPRQVADLLLQKVRLISDLGPLSMTNVYAVPNVTKPLFTCLLSSSACYCMTGARTAARILLEVNCVLHIHRSHTCTA